MVEDNSADAFLVKEAVAASHLDVRLYLLSDGEEALRFFGRMEGNDVRCPDLLLLDLNVPKVSGHELLSYLRSTKRFATMPIVIMTSSSAKVDREKSTAFNINEYFTKPDTVDEFLRLGDIIGKLI